MEKESERTLFDKGKILIHYYYERTRRDVNNFLKTESGLKKLGVADATGIARYLGLQKMGVRVNVPFTTASVPFVIFSPLSYA